jgi:threonine synthase
MLTLDADSRMSADRVTGLVHTMETRPDAGLVQAGVRLAGAETRFVRMQQHATHLYSPAFPACIAGWAGNEGNYCGHNALIRVRAFAEWAALPTLSGRPPFGGDVLSHDFVEAAWLRRAGWAVVFEPEACGSAEGGPQTLAAFHRRDRRWCQGNLQHLRILTAARGVHPVSRLHLFCGVGSYVAAPFWLCLVVAATLSDSTGAVLMPIIGAIGLILVPKVTGVLLWTRRRPVVKQMIADGRDISAVACASTGDTSAALAAYAAAAGIPAIVILPRARVSPAQLVQPLANGALVLALDTDFDGCMAIVQRLAAEGTVYLANSMNSLRLEGQKTLSLEIVQQFDWEVPDVVVLPGGNLGNVSAIAAGFDMMLELGVIAKRPRIVVAQAEAANPLYTAYRSNWAFAPMKAKPTLASAIQIGNPVSINKAIRALTQYDGIVEQASESELAEAAARADRTGMFNCPHTAVALAALEKIVARGEIKRSDRVIVISTANGLKFSEFKTAYHTRTLAGVTPQHANPPVELPNDYDAVRRAIDGVAASRSGAR